jgi:diguanylate cyclase (GGDEF)-like protein
MDIDHFKAVNDRYGHQQGDAVLRAVADIVKASVRDILDAPCRYGGEEFVVIMPDTDLPGALVVAERIRQAVEGHVMRGPEGVFHVTLSGGVAVMDSRNETTAMSLIEKADQALYEGKKNGRNQIRFPET